MPAAFVSYAREDLTFAEALIAALRAAGQDIAWDQEGHAIRPAAPFWPELEAAIRRSGKFIFVISPSSVDSRMCRMELEFARSLNKQVIPVVRRDVPGSSVPAGLEAANWVRFEDDAAFQTGLADLVDALDSDLGMAAEHARLLDREADWRGSGRPRSQLLRGGDLKAFEGFLSTAPATGSISPTQGQREYVAASRTGRRTRRQAGTAVLAVATGLAAFGLVQLDTTGHAASQAQAVGRSRELAAKAIDLQSSDLLTADQLALAAWRAAPTGEAGAALETLLAEQQREGLLPADTGPSGGVAGVAFSPDGTLLASADQDGTIRLWNPATGQAVGAPLIADSHPGGSVSGVAFSSDGKLLASADTDGTIRLWNPATSRPLDAPIAVDVASGFQGGVTGVAFSPGGKLLASAGHDGTIRLWNPATSRETGAPLMTRAGPSGGVTGVAFSPDGTLLASGGADGTVQWWNPATGALLRTAASSGGGVTGVAFSPDGTQLASANEDGTIRLWNPATGREIGRPIAAAAGGGVFGGVYAVAFSPDGKVLASAAGDGTIRLWNPATRREIGAALPGSTDAARLGPNGVAFGPDGRLVAGAGGTGVVRLWDPETGRAPDAPLPIAAPGDGGAYQVAFRPDGKVLASADSDGNVGLWDPATGRPAGPPVPVGASGGVTGVAFSPDGRLLASAEDWDARLWNPVTAQAVGQALSVSRIDLLAKPQVLDDVAVTGVAFSPDGTMVATVDTDGTIRFWDPATGHQAGPPIRVQANAVAFSPDGQVLASADTNGTIRLWNPTTRRATGPPIAADTGLKPSVNEVAFSPDGRVLASADHDGTIRLWDPATGQPAGPPIMADPGRWVNTVTFSPDGKLLASADADGIVRLWNPATGRAVGVPLPVDAGLDGQVYGVAFSPDGRLLASAEDETVDRWPVSLFADPYRALCADAGSLAVGNLELYVPSETGANICS
jgi:WD40 repeat protein